MEGLAVEGLQCWLSLMDRIWTLLERSNKGMVCGIGNQPIINATPCTMSSAMTRLLEREQKVFTLSFISTLLWI